MSSERSPHPDTGGTTSHTDLPQPPDSAPDGSRRARWPVAVRIVLAELALIAALGLVVAVSLIPPVRRLQESGQSAAGVVNSAAAVVNIVQCVLTMLVTVGLISLLMRYLDRRPMRETGWRWSKASLPLLALGLGLGAAINLSIALLLAAFGRARIVDVPWDELTTTLIVISVAMKLAQAFFLQGIPEELIFRGYLLQTLRERPKLAVAVSTGFFGIIHLLSMGGQETAVDRILYLAPATAFGFLAAVLVVRLRSLWPAVGVHAGFHLGNLILSFLGIDIGNAWGWLGLGLGYAIVGVLALRGHSWEPIRLER